MANYENFEVKGIVTTLSPISHSTIPPYGSELKKGRQWTNFRSMPFVLQNEEGKEAPASVYTVSGNSIRGIMRTLLYRHTFQDVLDIDFDELLGADSELKMSTQKRRFLVATLASGGVTPKGTKLEAAAPAGEYERILRDIPMLDLFGGVYLAHHFDGCASIGNMTLRCKETKTLFGDMFHDDNENLPDISSISTTDIRFTRTQSNQDASENPDMDDSEENNKAKAIFGTNVLPAGTTFYWRNYCNTANEGTKLAFYAAIALLQKYASVGGMSGKGLGRVSYDLEPDLKDAIKDYDEYILEHKDECIEAIKSMAKHFLSSVKTKAEAEEEAAAKKTKKGKKAAKKTGEAIKEAE